MLPLTTRAAFACTEVQVRAPTGELVVGNTVEAGVNARGLDHHDLVVTPTPRGKRLGGHGGPGSGCMSYTSKYGFLQSTSSYYLKGGMNEAGLGINHHALELAVFQEPDPTGATPSLCKPDISSWALGLHANVAEVVAGLRSVRFVGERGDQWGLHYATGASVVIEFVKGVLTAHNNSVGLNNTGIGLLTNEYYA